LQTLESVSEEESFKRGRVAGLVAVWQGGRARLSVLPLVDGAIELGREHLAAVIGDDERVSRRHTRVRFDGSAWHIADLGSRNGTFVDGARVAAEGEVTLPAPTVLRIGETLFLFTDDAARFGGATVAVAGGLVMGPTLRAAWDEIRHFASAGEVLHITGETGTGKELAARHFHDASERAKAPFVAVNCATIPPSLAERLLFGARRGAYSGADRDVDGYFQTADGGTLFLDEIGELSLEVQSKLLRVLETREVVPLGAVRGQKVRLGIVSATHTDLRDAVARRTFRDDLYFRLARPAVRVPPLRERLEELPFLVESVVRAAPPIGAKVSLVETALRRAWPGNVRELLAELGSAKSRAQAAGRTEVGASQLAPAAGTVPAVATDSTTPPAAAAESDEPLAPPSWRGVSAARIQEVLRAEHGNVSAAARALGLHRNQLVRLMHRFGIDR